ncbi:MAG: TolC family protein [Bacteroidota bacterium]|nr:TolC family protein [Bacteroidota bacterium]
MKTLATILLTLLFAPAVPAQQLLRLEDAIAIGLENNHRIIIARNSAAIAENNNARGSAGFLPTLDASGSWSLAHSEQETNSPFSFGNSDTRTASAQLALNWTLFDGFRMFAENARYSELARLGETQTRNTIEQTVVGIVAAYMRAVQETRLLDALSRVLNISRMRYEKEAVRRELGGSASDYYNARIAFNNDSSAFLTQRLQLRVARQDLNLLLGRDIDVAFDVTRDIDLPAPPDDVEVIAERARARNAELTVMRQNLRVAETNVSSSRSTFFPRLNFFASYGYSDRLTGTSDERFSGDISTQSADASVGLSFSFNLFNGFRNSTDVQNAQLEQRSAATAVEEAEYRLEALLREQVQTLETRLQAASLVANSLEAASSNLALQVERYETGTVTSLEFRDAQLQFVRAETAYIVALFQARIAALELQRLTGDIRLR